MGLDQNEPIRRLDQILASQGAMIAPAGHRPQTGNDASGLGDPRFFARPGELVEIAPPEHRAGLVPQTDHARVAGSHHAEAVSAQTHHARAVQLDGIFGRRCVAVQVGFVQQVRTAIPTTGRHPGGARPRITGGHVAQRGGKNHQAHGAGLHVQHIQLASVVIGRESRLAGQPAAGPVVRSGEQFAAASKE